MKIAPPDEKRTNFNGGKATAVKQSVVHGHEHDQRERNHAT